MTLTSQWTGLQSATGAATKPCRRCGRLIHLHSQGYVLTADGYEHAPVAGVPCTRWPSDAQPGDGV